MKHQVLTDLNENEAQIHRTFQPATTSSMVQFLETLKQKLSSPCAYNNHYLLQLTAWTLHKNIEIHNIFDTCVMTLSGEAPWLLSDCSFPLSPLSTIQTAYPQHHIFWSCDQNFRPIKNHNCHYWVIIKIGQHRPCQRHVGTPPAVDTTTTLKNSGQPHNLQLAQFYWFQWHYPGTVGDWQAFGGEICSSFPPPSSPLTTLW